MFAPMTGTSCLLFFPGTSPELLPKAIASGADQVCVDLEDAVAPEAKSTARASVLDLLANHTAPPRLVVRINHPNSPDGEQDLEAIVGIGRLPGPLTIMVPKIDGLSEVDSVRHRLGPAAGDIAIIPVIETARGLANVEEIAGGECVSALLFGGLDLSVDLDCALEWEPLLYARSRCVHAARLANVDLIDTPFFDVEDPEALRLEADRAGRLGFSAKAAIHPSQVTVIREAFQPSAERLERAQRIVATFEREPRGTFLLDGVMIDRPAVEAARRVIDRSESKEE
jgi:(S)-citramalyl-CoA lyase